MKKLFIINKHFKEKIDVTPSSFDDCGEGYVQDFEELAQNVLSVFKHQDHPFYVSIEDDENVKTVYSPMEIDVPFPSIRKG